MLQWCLYNDILLPSTCKMDYINMELIVSPARFSVTFCVTFFSGTTQASFLIFGTENSVSRTVSCNAFLNLRHVHFLFDATLNIVDIGKFAHKIISVATLNF